MAEENEPLLSTSQTQTLPLPRARLEQLFAEHHARVYSAAYRVTGNAQDAEDVLQTVFLRLLKRQDELELAPESSGYMHRAAVNAALDLIRSRARARSIGLDDLPSEPADGRRADPLQRQEDRETRRMVRQAILTLSPKNAEVFTLRYLEGVDNHDIARMVGMSQTAVGVALFRARNQVKKELRSLL